MKCTEVIRVAWKLTNSKKGLIWYGVVPTFFTLLVGLGYFSYQFFAFEFSPFFGNKHFDFDRIGGVILDFIAQHNWLIGVGAVAGIVVAIGYFLVPPLVEGGLIGLIAAFHREKEGVEARDGIVIGTHHFFKMFEYGMVVSVFSFFEFLTIASLTVRHLGAPGWLIILLSFLFVVSFLFGIIFIYAPNFIVLENRGVIAALGGSARLVIGNFGKTFLMWFLMLLISVRVVINVVLVFLIPLLVAFIANFFAGQLAFTFGIILALVAGLVVICLAAYLGGVLHVFTTAAWTITFLDLDHTRAEKLLAE